MDFVVVDIETANAELTSICSIGIATIENLTIADRVEYMVRPVPFVFDPGNVAVNGITADLVADAPTFDHVWEKIAKYFTPFTPCIAHNAPFDFSHIKATLDYYHLPFANCPILCSWQYARGSNFFRPQNYKLATLCEYFGVVNAQAHHALSDALATAEIMVKMIEENGDNLFDMIQRGRSGLTRTGHQPRRRAFENVRQQDITTTVTEFDSGHPLYQKTVVITGDLTTMSRADAYLKIKNCGGLVGDQVTKKTNFLVTNSAAMTGKMKKALAYQDAGQEISVITEEQLLSLLDSGAEPPA